MITPDQPLTAAPVALRPHPYFRHSPVTGITVDAVRRSGGALRIRFVLLGAIDRIRLSPPAAPMRRDDLWRTTCFEAFLMADDMPGYHEANFSPSGAWAAYSFDRYRTNMRKADIAAPPHIVTDRAIDRFTLEVIVDASWIPPAFDWRVGLSAVIEASDGVLSYWALTHPPGHPDFHHRDCFALKLAATTPS